MFIQRFLISNLWNALLICLMLGLKWILRRKISLKFQYLSWYVLFASLPVPFLPNGLWANWGMGSLYGDKRFAVHPAGEAMAYGTTDGNGWLHDTTQMAANPSLDWGYSLILLVWLLGVIGMLGTYWCGAHRLCRLRRYAAKPSREIQMLFQEYKQQIVPRHTVELRQSRLVSAPVSFGILPPVVVLPGEKTDSLSRSELRHIFLHELTHIRHGDVLTNYFLCGFQAVYWFNPFVWLAMRQLRQDREAYCDWSVMNGFRGEEERIGYGRTILRLAALKSNVHFGLVSGFSSGKSQLKYRLEQIVAFRRETGISRILCSLCAVLLIMISIVQIPVLALYLKIGEEYYAPSEALTIAQADFGNLFHRADGCAVIYDRNADSYIAYNREEITRRLPPCSTYKIYSGLNALEMGIIHPGNSTLAWDGTQYGNPRWNADQDLTNAMQESTNWYFQQLDRQAGPEQLARFYQTIGYGNGYVGNDVSAYWNGSALRISALEQVELLYKLYRNTCGFQDANVQAILDSMRLYPKGDAVLYGKTGTGELDGQNIAGWFIGFVEKPDNVYFFAVYLCSDAGGDGATAADTAIKILEQMGII